MRQSAGKKVVEVADGMQKAGKSSLFQKMLDDQRAISDYFQGKVTIEEIHARGIKLVKPL
ncbi:hypothetical protein [Dyadobacter alkalitolerans]|uniref:hypothetical protein n=1 Tax=Dyadobacter alkalitolerans TaxID=492736 RepID=UPI00042023CB|nr:hypothetical protein [Dyadobacter alkalitolerans]